MRATTSPGSASHASSAAASGPADSAGGLRPRVVPITDGVDCYEQPDGGWCVSNAGIVSGSRHTLLVDTLATLPRAAALHDTVAARSPHGRASYVLNTHFHGDHTFGNQLFVPGAALLGHARTRADMLDAGLALTGLWPDVAWGPVRVTPPELTFTDPVVLDLGGREVHLLPVGPAHTVGDVVAWLPDERVLFAGDVALAGCTPFVLMGSLSGALRALDRLQELDPAVVVPGHGRVGGPEILDDNRAYLRWVASVATRARPGVSPLDLARRTDLGDFADLLDAERLVANLHRALAEAAGAAPGADLDVMPAFADMVEVNGGVPGCHA